MTSDADREKRPPIQQHVTSHNQSGGITAHTVNINPPTPRSPTKLYQDGHPVADVTEPRIDEGTQTISFPVIWNTDSLDYSKPVEFRNAVLGITSADLGGRTLMGMAPNGQMGRNITPNVVAKVLGLLRAPTPR